MSELTVPWRMFLNALEHLIPYNDTVGQGLFNEIYYIRGKVPGSISITPEGKLEYIPVYGREWLRMKAENPGLELPKPRRTSLIRFLRWLSQYEPQYAGYERFQPMQDKLVEWARTTLSGTDFSYEVVTGGDLVEAYNTGPKSCMKGRTSQLALYSSNPNRIGLVKMYDKGVYKGRALLWLLDDGRQFLDRIYPGNDVMAAWMRAQAKKNGWEHKSVDSVSGDTTSTTPMMVTVAHPRNRRIPFLDTMSKMYAIGENYVTLSDRNLMNADGTDMLYFEDIGDYVGTSNIYRGPQYKFLDGSPVPNQYVGIGHNNAYYRIRTAPEPDYWVLVKVGERYVRRYLKSTDNVYVDDRRRVLNVASDPETHFLYLRTDMRRSPKTGQLRPKKDAVKLVITDLQKFTNGGVAVTVKPEA